MPAPPSKDGPRINDEIRVPRVLLIDEHGEKQGIMPTAAALEAAEEAGLDLVEVSPNSDPPVCKILDYGKFKFQEQKKKGEARKRQKLVEIKEIKLRPNIDTHDYDVKAKGASALPRRRDAPPRAGHEAAATGQDRVRAGGQGRIRAAPGRPADDHD